MLSRQVRRVTVKFQFPIQDPATLVSDNLAFALAPMLSISSILQPDLYYCIVSFRFLNTKYALQKLIILKLIYFHLYNDFS